MSKQLVKHTLPDKMTIMHIFDWHSTVSGLVGVRQIIMTLAFAVPSPPALLKTK